MPINLDVTESDIDRLGIKPGTRIALIDSRDDAALAIITGPFLPLGPDNSEQLRSTSAHSPFNTSLSFFLNLL